MSVRKRHFQEDVPNCRELRLRNVPCVPISSLGLKGFEDASTENAQARHQVLRVDKEGPPPKRHRLRKLSERDGQRADNGEIHPQGQDPSIKASASCIASPQLQRQYVQDVCQAKKDASQFPSMSNTRGGLAGIRHHEGVVNQSALLSAAGETACSNAELGSGTWQGQQPPQCSAVLPSLQVIVDLDCISHEKGQPRAASDWLTGDRGLRRSNRLARHAATRPTARQQLNLTQRRPRNGAQTNQPQRVVEALSKEVGVSVLPSSPVLWQQECRVGRESITKRFSSCFALPRINCVAGRWEREMEQDGCLWKRMRLPDSFFSDLLSTIGGGAGFSSCEWGGMLKAHWDAGRKEALLRLGSKPERGLHDRIQVAEGPFSWHSHAILGDSWPNLPSTADLLGVIRDSNLRRGGRGHVHLVVTPIGTWLLQATERLVHDMYDGGTRRRAEDVLAVQLEQIFDAHKCSVGYLPGAVPTEAPDFWMAVPEHERAIRNALKKKGRVQAQVTAYAAQLQGAGFVVGFAGHGAADACFPIVYKSADQDRGPERSQQSGTLSSCSAGQSLSLMSL